MDALREMDRIIRAEKLKQEADLKNLENIVQLIKDLDQKFEKYLSAITSPDQYKIMNMEEICKLTSLSKSFIESKMREGTFPIPKKFGSTNRWYKRDIEQWIRENMET